MKRPEINGNTFSIKTRNFPEVNIDWLPDHPGFSAYRILAKTSIGKYGIDTAADVTMLDDEDILESMSHALRRIAEEMRECRNTALGAVYIQDEWDDMDTRWPPELCGDKNHFKSSDVFPS